MNNLAPWAYAESDYDAAGPLFRRALAICEVALGSIKRRARARFLERYPFPKKGGRSAEHFASCLF